MKYSRVIVFLLSPRLLDFDTYVPIAKAIRDVRPEWRIVFVSFDETASRYMARNEMLYQIASDHAEILCLTGGKPLLRKLAFALKLFALTISRRSPVLFLGRPFSSKLFVMLRRIARIRGGDGHFLRKDRGVDQLVPPVIEARWRQRDAAENSSGKSAADKNFGKFISYSGQDTLHLLSSGIHASDINDRSVAIGLPNFASWWSSLIETKADELRVRLSHEHPNASGPTFSVFPGKLFAGTTQRDMDSPKDSFRKLIRFKQAHYPDSLMVIRLHPVDDKSSFFSDCLEEEGAQHCCFLLDHPEVIVRATDFSFVTAHTNIQVTTPFGRFIDFSDYDELHFQHRGEKSLADGFGSLYVNPQSTDYQDEIADLISNPDVFDQPANLWRRQEMIEKHQFNVTKLLEAIKEQ